MSNKITTYADVEIVGTLTKARDNGVARVIEQQLLDGTFKRWKSAACDLLGFEEG